MNVCQFLCGSISPSCGQTADQITIDLCKEICPNTTFSPCSLSNQPITFGDGISILRNFKNEFATDTVIKTNRAAIVKNIDNAIIITTVFIYGGLWLIVWISFLIAAAQKKIGWGTWGIIFIVTLIIAIALGLGSLYYLRSLFVDSEVKVKNIISEMQTSDFITTLIGGS